MQGFFIFGYFVIGYSAWYVYFTIGFSVLASVEKLVILWIIPELQSNMRGLCWILRHAQRLAPRAHSMLARDRTWIPGCHLSTWANPTRDERMGQSYLRSASEQKALARQVADRVLSKLKAQ